MQYICVILFLLPLTSMGTSLETPGHQSTTKSNSLLLSLSNTNQHRNKNKSEHLPDLTVLAADSPKHKDNSKPENPRQAKNKLICNKGDTPRCYPKSKTDTITWPATINKFTNKGIVYDAASQHTFRRIDRPKRNVKNLFQFTEGSPKPRRQPKFTGNGRMFQMQEFYNMLKASQRQRQQQQQIQKQTQAEVQQSEEGTGNEPQYLPRITIEPTSDLIYSQLGLRHRNLENRGSRAIPRVLDQRHRNGTILSDEAKRNIFSSKGWGASGSLEMLISRESPSMTQGFSDTTPYAFTSKHWGPLGKREEQEKKTQDQQPLAHKSGLQSKLLSQAQPKNKRLQWTPFISQFWTPLGKSNYSTQGFVFTNSHSWKPLGKRNHMTHPASSGHNRFHYS